MVYLGFVMLGALIVVFFGCIAQLIRLRYWSKFVNSEIDRVFSARVDGDLSQRWPDVDASYNNFKWYQPFRYNFKSMMVYDAH